MTRKEADMFEQQVPAFEECYLCTWSEAEDGYETVMNWGGSSAMRRPKVRLRRVLGWSCSGGSWLPVLADVLAQRLTVDRKGRTNSITTTEVGGSTLGRDAGEDELRAVLVWGNAEQARGEMLRLLGQGLIEHIPGPSHLDYRGEGSNEAHRQAMEMWQQGIRIENEEAERAAVRVWLELPTLIE